MPMPDFVEIHRDVTINPRYVARIERVPNRNPGPDSARIVMHDGTDYLVGDWNYSYALQRICGLFR